jgi:HAD superfamily hydrolase (TIGR01549 family)
VPGVNRIEPVKAILFDVDGTLVDSISMIVAGLGDTFEKYSPSRPSQAELLTLIGMPLSAQLKLFGIKGDITEMTQYTLDRFEAYQHLEKEFEPAVDALIVASNAGIRTCAVTSKNQQEITTFLAHFRATKYFTATVCASDVAAPKPDPESAHRALMLLNVNADEAVMVGDSIYDLRCARGAGLRCGAALYGAGKREDLLAEAPDYIFETPHDLKEWVESQASQFQINSKSEQTQYATEANHTNF